MKLLADIEYAGWRLRGANELRGKHWAAIKRLTTPPVASVYHKINKYAFVFGPHPCRTVEVTRIGPREMDYDNLVSSMKRALDLLKCRKILSAGEVHVVGGLLWDDKPQYAKLVAKQEKGPYGVRIRVFDGTKGAA